MNIDLVKVAPEGKCPKGMDRDCAIEGINHTQSNWNGHGPKHPLERVNINVFQREWSKGSMVDFMDALVEIWIDVKKSMKEVEIGVIEED